MSAGAGEPQPASFVSGVHRIDANVHRPEGPPRGAIVLAHPHPAHGGDMEHPVLLLAAARAVAGGLLALRFDFRGVGRSEGSVADRDGHLEDALRACEDAARRAPGVPLLAGGFSYGARTFARAVAPGAPSPPAVRGLLLLAPATRVPRTARDFGHLLLGRPLTDAPPDPEAVASLGAIPLPVRAIVGSEDRVAPSDELRAALPPHAVLDVLPGLSHLFSRNPGAGPVAEDLLVPALDRALAALLSPRT